MARQIPLPLSWKSYDQLYGTWRKFALIQESGSCYYHNKSDLLYRIQQLRDDPRLSGKYLKGVSLHVIDGDTIHDEDSLTGWEEAFRPVGKGQRHSQVLVVGMDGYLLRGESRIFHYLMQKEIDLGTVSILLFFNTDYLHPKYRNVFDASSTWIRNVVRFSLHSHDDTLAYLDHQSAVWRMKVSRADRETISRKAGGGYFVLPKQALRYMRDNPGKQDLMFHHPEMDLRLDIIWRQLLQSEQDVLRKIMSGVPVIDPTEKHSLEFLTETGWINRINGRHVVSMPLLADYIRNIAPPIRMDVSGGRILLNDIPIDASFSGTEKRLVTELVKRKNEMVTRDEVVAVINNDNEEYSDWAIDKTVSRLRKKLARLNIPSDILQTAHGKGFVFRLSPDKHQI